MFGAQPFLKISDMIWLGLFFYLWSLYMWLQKIVLLSSLINNCICCLIFLSNFYNWWFEAHSVDLPWIWVYIILTWPLIKSLAYLSIMPVTMLKIIDNSLSAHCHSWITSWRLIFNTIDSCHSLIVFSIACVEAS